MGTTATPAPRFKGQEQELGGTTYVVPPLALGALRELLPRIKQITTLDGIPGVEEIDTIIDVAAAAIQRNYPAMTREELLTLIDVGNMRPLFKAIMALSGLESASGNSGAGAASP